MCFGRDPGSESHGSTRRWSVSKFRENSKLGSGMRKGQNTTTDPIKFLFVLVSIAFTFILFISILQIHELPVKNGPKVNSTSRDAKIGKLGEMVIEMLPVDLGFTVFLPSEKAMERDLGLRWNHSLGEAKVDDDTYALLTRVLGFSAVPAMIYWDSVVSGEEISYDSVCGFRLFIGKDLKGSCLVVNGVGSEKVDLRRGKKIVVHVMNGVLMDAEFQHSVLPE